MIGDEYLAEMKAITARGVEVMHSVRWAILLIGLAMTLFAAHSTAASIGASGDAGMAAHATSSVYDLKSAVLDDSERVTLEA